MSTKNSGNYYNMKKKSWTHSYNISRVYFDNMDKAVLKVPIAIEDILDLSDGNAYIGFTGATGGLNQIQDILSWKFSEFASRNQN